MRVECRKLKNDKQYFSFVYWDGQKRVRLKKDEHPHFESKIKAEEWAKAKEAEINTTKSRIQRRLQWKTQYYNFETHSEDYINHCKKTQPNSWKNTQFILEHYVFPYFLEIKKSNNVNNWHLHFEDFKRWLEDEACILNKKKSLISYSTKNHCIKTLNTFLSFMKIQNLVDPSNIYKVSGFPAHKIGSRNAEHLISREEFEAVKDILNKTNPEVAVFWETAYEVQRNIWIIYG